MPANNFSIPIIFYFFLPLVVGLASYIMRTLMSRVDILEQKMEARISEEQARQIIQDKLEPMSEDLNEIKGKLDKLVDYLIIQKKP